MRFKALIASALTLAAAGGSVAQGTETSGDQALAQLVQRTLPAIRAAADAARQGHGPPDAIQIQYDLARDAQQKLMLLPPTTTGCQHLRQTFEHYLRAQILQAEGVDRPSAPALAKGVRLALSSDRSLRQQTHSCSGGGIVAVPPAAPELTSPKDGEACFGTIEATLPHRVTRVELRIDGHPTKTVTVAVTSPRLRIAVSARSGKHTFELRLFAGHTLIGRRSSADVWLLPPTATNVKPLKRRDPAVDASLSTSANAFDGYSAIWTEDLTTGTYGAWNEDARFPAASTVKLGVLVAALRRWGPFPERSDVAYDLKQLTGWSSNLAANRLLRQLGGTEQAGAEVVQRTLAQLGANASTYTGDYRVGTVAHAQTASSGAPDPPPLVSRRVTTARDLATILRTLAQSTLGVRQALRAAHLTVHEARVGLAWLLSSQPTGENIGLFRPWLPTTPIAQKNGWLNEAHHTAGIIYAPDGPKLVVALTYRPQALARSESAKLGLQVLRAAGLVR